MCRIIYKKLSQKFLHRTKSDKSGEILDYFKGCETASLQVAQQELSENGFSWEQLKIMRIKFLNVYGM